MTERERKYFGVGKKNLQRHYELIKKGCEIVKQELSDGKYEVFTAKELIEVIKKISKKPKTNKQ